MEDGTGLHLYLLRNKIEALKTKHPNKTKKLRLTRRNRSWLDQLKYKARLSVNEATSVNLTTLNKITS